MKRLLGIAAALVLAAGAVLAVTTLAAAQGRARVVQDGVFLDGTGATIGVVIRDLTAEEASGEAARGGVVIDRVEPGTPAARAGFKDGDIAIEFDGERVRSARQFTRLVRETSPGRAVDVTVLRGGSRETVSVTPEARTAGILVPDDLQERIERGLERLPRNFEFDFDFDFPPQAFSRGRLGASLTPLTPQLAEYFGAKEGLLVASVEPESAAAGAGLRAGDVIVAVGGTSVRNASDVTRAMRQLQPGATAEMRIVREKKEMTLTVTAPERPAPRRRALRGVTA